MDERLYERRIVTCDAKERDAINIALEKSGWGPNCFSIPLYGKGKSTEKDAKPTQYAMHVALNEQRLQELLAAGVDVKDVTDPGKERAALKRFLSAKDLEKTADDVKAVEK